MTPAESEAETLLEDFGLTLPIDPESVCKSISTDAFKINYVEEAFTTPSICGLSLSHGNNIEVIINSKISNRHRKRFTSAHEIGHVVLHIQKGIQSEFSCTENDLNGKGDSNRQLEKEANEFASSLLMPSSKIKEMIRRSDLNWRLIQDIAELCDTSLEATARRVITLSKENCALIIHKNGQMWTPIRSNSFNSFIQKIPFPKNLDSSNDNIGIKLPTDLLECDTIDWIDKGRSLPDSLLYSSIHNAEYDRRMTLLLVPEVDEEEITWSEPHF